MNKRAILIAISLIFLVTLIGCQGVEPDSIDPPDQPPTDIVEEHEVALYFTDVDSADVYREYQTVLILGDESLELAALEAWIKGPDSALLDPLVNHKTEAISVENDNGIAEVNFSKEILNTQAGSSGESFILQQIVMIMEQFGYQSTQILVEGEIVESLLGHVMIDKPLLAFSQKAYLDVELIEKEQFVAQNNTFKLFTPAPNSVQAHEPLVVKGLARVWEASFSYELVDSEDMSFSAAVMASEGAPGWGEFEFIIDLDDLVGPFTLTLYETSAIDSSPTNQLAIEFDVAD